MRPQLHVLDNPQPPEKPVPLKRNDAGEPLIETVGEPWITIQGEGPFAGRPAVFVRLAGCNLNCRLCDTDYTTGREEVTVRDLVGEILELTSQVVRLVVITGGEPFRQEALSFLVRDLIEKDLEVQIETNGTLWQDLPIYSPLLTIVCSPKTPTVKKEIEDYSHSFKYVVATGHTDAKDGLPLRVLGKECKAYRPSAETRSRRWFSTPLIFVQPEEDGDRTPDNVAHACQLSMKFGYRLSLQLHKVVGLL